MFFYNKGKREMKQSGERSTLDDRMQDDRIYEMSQIDRNPAPTHLPKQGFFNLRHHIDMV